MSNLVDNFPAIRTGMNDGAPAAVSATPDADLIRLCAEFDALSRKADAVWEAENTGKSSSWSDENVKPILNEQRDLLLQIIALRAQTQAGFEARAHTMMLWYDTFETEVLEEYTDPADHGNWHYIMLAAFFRDAVGHDLVAVRRGLIGEVQS